MSNLRYIGGFFEMDSSISERLCSRDIKTICNQWMTELPTAYFINGRSAFAALITQVNPRRVWLPAFLCNALIEAVPTSLLRYYAVGGTLTPDVEILEQFVQKGDMLLGINYFGFPPAADFIKFCAKHKEIWFVEDCAHYLAYNHETWGDWRLYSPRKLLGVADGGLVIASRPGLRVPQPSRPVDEPWQHWQAAVQRFGDIKEERVNEWHLANQRHEKQMCVSREGMSCLSREILITTDSKKMILRRKTNFDELMKYLNKWQMLFPSRSSMAPFAFPILVPELKRDELLSTLHSQGIFAAVHWRDMPSPTDLFPVEHLLTRKLISLPCDHRYDSDDMYRIACVVSGVMG